MLARRLPPPTNGSRRKTKEATNEINQRIANVNCSCTPPSHKAKQQQLRNITYTNAKSQPQHTNEINPCNMKLRTTRKFKHKRKLMFNQTCSNCPLPPFLRIFDFALTVFEPLKILVSSFGTYARPAFPPALARAGRDLSCRGETPQGQKPYTSGAFASPPAGARAPRCSSSTVRECGLGRPKPIRGSEHSGRLARTLKFPNSVLPVMAVLPVTKSPGLC